ncbi:hypothetical protein PSI15_11000 [Xenorhabdus sp. PR6a]|uniref:hypothetical protein n=1 Tax=Xenorhabdus sp. PR6a TaxID=3025877 RepID=UPI0023595DB3|nr:hypothetical protein [Xenorhabdus sp. PR6a]MDC9582085.1 hypothetical protein [Xenorhabdus sp. PR6a]
MKMLNRNSVVIIKRFAVKTLFWPACPLDDDHCFDRIMRADVIDMAFQDRHALYLHRADRNNSDTQRIKNSLRKAAIQLVILVADVTPEVAETILNKWDTSEPVNGEYAQGSYDYLLRKQ